MWVSGGDGSWFFQCLQQPHASGGGHVRRGYVRVDRRCCDERMKEEKFARLQRRRAQTEARIGILKTELSGPPDESQGI